MFKKARIKLTAWYSIIIMVVSLSFSVAIYLGVNRELIRLEGMQTQRQARVDRISTFLRDNGLPVPPEESSALTDSETVEQARLRIIATLGLINLSILFLSGAAGYFLAGRTLDPIAEMVDEQKEFVGNASHELRTPLTSLMTEIEVALRDKSLSLGDARKLLQSNLEDVDRMQKLSNYLLKLHRYEKGASLEFGDVDLKQVVEKATSGFKFKFDLDLKKSVVRGNEDSLIELVTILLDNAIKYSPKGKDVEVSVKAGGTLEVEDHGSGIAKEDLPHIFDRFYRSDKSRGTDGYGLGLSIAKSIVDLHNGAIKVESRFGKGSKFIVSFG
jgi:signal transduction histidine kinase